MSDSDSEVQINAVSGRSDEDVRDNMTSGDEFEDADVAPISDSETELQEAVCGNREGERRSNSPGNLLGVQVDAPVSQIGTRDFGADGDGIPPLYEDPRSSRRKRVTPVRDDDTPRHSRSRDHIRHNEIYNRPRNNRDYPSDTHYTEERHYSTYRRGPSMKPETYSGAGDWESFISHFDVCSRLGGWSPRTKALTLLACMRGQAQLYLLNLSEAEKDSFTILSSKLAARFGGNQQKPLWASRLENRKRKPGESIAELGDDIRRLTRKAYSNLGIAAQDMLGMQQLLKSTSPELRYRCITEECDTVEKAVEIIQTYEDLFGETAPKTAKSTVRMVQSKQSNRTDPDTKSSQRIERSLEQLTDRIDRLERRQMDVYRQPPPPPPNWNGPIQGRRSGPPVCYQCGSPDHFYRDCPMPRDGRMPNAGNARFSSGMQAAPSAQGNGKQLTQ
ncbi:MAG: hypothetical protein ABW185_20005 [Sedimenticola sp.]